jgi:hypothetical protein
MTQTATPIELPRLDAKDLAKLIRAALKLKFPGVTFSVRTQYFSMGSSVNICWTAGPSREAVNEVTKPFQGIGFDGMDDSTTYQPVYILKDGTASHTKPSDEQLLGCYRATSYVALSRTHE